MLNLVPNTAGEAKKQIEAPKTYNTHQCIKIFTNKYILLFPKIIKFTQKLENK